MNTQPSTQYNLHFWPVPFAKPTDAAQFADTEKLMEMMRDINQKMNRIMERNARPQVWVHAKDIEVLAGKTRKELEDFRRNNPGLWKDVSTTNKPSYRYNKNAF